MTSLRGQPSISTDCERGGVEHALAWVRGRLRGRPDREHEITLNRIMFSALINLYLLIATAMGSADAAAMLPITTPPFVLYFIVTMALFAHVLWQPQVCERRRVFGMACDFGMLTFLALTGGLKAGFFYPIYLWTVFGNGFRFGIPYLYIAMGFANASFLAVLIATNIWREHTGLSIALFACLIMLPLYAAKLIRNLSEAKRQAEEANRAKTTFLASVSHELRTPLNAIIGLGGLLHDQLRNAERRHMVSTIVNSGRSLLRLINSILDFSRIEAGRMPSTVAEIDLYEAIWRLKAMLAVQATSKGLTFGVHITGRTPAHIAADYNHIEQILINLAANAIKFTESGFVVIAIDAIHQQADRVRLRFEVSDTGIGIPVEAQNRIFESFAQADTTILDKYGGTGLGLAISKQLVSLLGGRMGLDSTVGQGSTFWFEVEVTQVSTEDEASEMGETPVVLVSGDDALKKELERIGLAVVAVERLEEAAAAVHVSSASSGEQAIAFYDRREAADAADTPDTLFDALQRLHDHTPGLVVVTDDAGISPLPASLRSTFVSSLSAPIAENAVRRAVRAAKRAASNAPADMEQTQILVPAGRSLSILVAEDNRTNQMVIEKTLERVGHKAILVNNGEEALHALQNDRFDLVLMDVNMPIMNGIEATKLYRFASIGQPRVPIVALTADATSEAWTRCQEAGMDGYATKPIEPARLLEIIDAMVDGSDIDRSQATSATDDAVEARQPPSNDEALIDLIALADLERLGGPGFISGVVSQFSDDAAELLSSLREAVAEENVQRFRDAVHALRGSAANLGAARVFSNCLALRAITPSQLAVEGDERVAQLMDDVDDTIELLKAHIAAHRDETLAEGQARVA
jgi:two-component system sensor histidine kinase RpfC